MRLGTAWCSALVLAAASFATPATAGGYVLDGRAPPEISLECGLNGLSPNTTLASLRGKVVCIKFWLTNCPVCRGTLPEFQDLQDRYGRSGLVCIGIVEDSAQGVQPYLSQAGWSFPVGCDAHGRNAAQYGVTRYPANYVIGVDGIVRSSDSFSREVILEELRKQRLLEWGTVPDPLRPARDLVEDGDYGGALRVAEPLAKSASAAADVKASVAKLVEISTQRLENRLVRAADVTKSSVASASAEFKKIVEDFAGTSLEARARERWRQFLAAHAQR